MGTKDGSFGVAVGKGSLKADVGGSDGTSAAAVAGKGGGSLVLGNGGAYASSDHLHRPAQGIDLTTSTNGGSSAPAATTENLFQVMVGDRSVKDSDAISTTTSSSLPTGALVLNQIVQQATSRLDATKAKVPQLSPHRATTGSRMPQPFPHQPGPRNLPSPQRHRSPRVQSHLAAGSQRQVGSIHAVLGLAGKQEAFVGTQGTALHNPSPSGRATPLLQQSGQPGGTLTRMMQVGQTTSLANTATPLGKPSAAALASPGAGSSTQPINGMRPAMARTQSAQ